MRQWLTRDGQLFVALNPYKRHPRLFALGLALAFAEVAGRAPVSAQNTIAAETVTAAPGDTGVTVPLTIANDRPLTVLSAEIGFDGSLCTQIENQALSAGSHASREHGPQEGGIRCPSEGKVTVVFFDLTGGEVVPVGSGTVALWRFDVRHDAPGGVFPLSVTVNMADHGAEAVPLSVTAGQLTIAAPTPTMMSTPTTACTGDCNRDGDVAIDELIRGVGIALTTTALDQCPAVDRNSDGTVTVEELIAAVGNALSGCP